MENCEIQITNKGLIVNFMFANDKERKISLNTLSSKGREDLCNAIKNKHYTNIEKYIKDLDCKIHFEHMVNFTWIVEIEKI